MAGENDAEDNGLPEDDALPAADEGTPEPEAESQDDAAPAKGAKKETEEKGKKDEKPKLVDLRALQQARAELRAEREERKREREQYEKRWQQILERTAPKQPEQPTPEFEKDPAAWLRHQTENAGKKLQDFEQWKQQQEQQRQQSQAEQELAYAVTAAEQEFSAATPDYPDALQFAQQARLKYFRAAGMSHAEAVQTLQNETRFVANMALRQGANPAERIYQIARELGYKPSQKQIDPTSKIQQLQKGQKASSPLSGGGAEDESSVTLGRLAEMDDDEFDKHWDRLKKAGKLG